MLQSEKENQRLKEEIKTAWEDGDLLGLLKAGIDGFLNMVGNSAPLPFQRFLEYTGVSFDTYILDISRQEQLNYLGGKMTLKTGTGQPDGPTPVHLLADFYFQTRDKQWVMKQKSGQVDSSRFLDWDRDPAAVKLQQEGKLELTIDPPHEEGK